MVISAFESKGGVRNVLPYCRAQLGMTHIKSAVYELLFATGEQGLTNAEIGRTLGIHMGHVRHEGHIPRTILALLESEGVAEQDAETKRWRLRH